MEKAFWRPSELFSNKKEEVTHGSAIKSHPNNIIRSPENVADMVNKDVTCPCAHWVKGAHEIGSNFCPYFPVLSPNTEKYGLEITPYLDTFHT